MANRKKAINDSVEQFMKQSQELPLLEAEVEFSHIPLSKIVIAEQVREDEDIESDEDFAALVTTIKEKKLIQPILVCLTNDPQRYRLVTGERRYRASKVAGEFSIPARIRNEALAEEEILKIQLIENLHRKDINAISEGRAYLKLYATEKGDADLEPQEMINDIILTKRDAERAKEEGAPHFGTILKISGKSLSYIEDRLILLKLPSNAQEAIKRRLLNPHQGSVFVRNIKHPKFEAILEKAIHTKMTAAAIEHAFREKKAKKDTVAGLQKQLAKYRSLIEKNRARITRQQAGQMLKQVEQLVNLLQGIAN